MHLAYRKNYSKVYVIRQMGPSRLYVDLRGFTQSPQEKRGNPGEHLDFSLFFEGFSSPDFAKISAAVLRIDLVSSRAPETNI